MKNNTEVYVITFFYLGVGPSILKMLIILAILENNFITLLLY